MDLTSLGFAIVASVVAAIGLWWHFLLAKRGIAGPRDRILGGVWAAVLVLSLGRIAWILSHDEAPQPAPQSEPRPAGPDQLDPAPIKK
jgi:hypothetical protein